MQTKWITAAEIRAILDYNPNTGDLTWKADHLNGVRAGDVAGYISSEKSGYSRRAVCIGRRMYWAHRLVWLWVHGVWPNGMIDHVNRDGTDNRIANLREANKAQNGANSVHRKGATGLRGVRFFRGRYQAQISVGNKTRYIGRFDSKEEASKAWLEAARKYRGEFAESV